MSTAAGFIVLGAVVFFVYKLAKNQKTLTTQQKAKSSSVTPGPARVVPQIQEPSDYQVHNWFHNDDFDFIKENKDHQLEPGLWGTTLQVFSNTIGNSYITKDKK